MNNLTEARCVLDSLTPFPEVPFEQPQRPASATPARRDEGQEAAILASLPLGLFVLDRDGRLTYLNAFAERFFAQVANRKREQLVGKSFWETCPEIADSSFAREYARATAEQRDFELEVYYPALGRWFALRAPLGQDAKPFFLQDITSRVQLERVARQHAEELGEVERGKNEFLVRLAHRLRNALVPIRNALHLMSDHPEAESDLVHVAALGEREVQSLSGFVDSLLRVSQVTSGKLRPRKERFDLAKVIARTLNTALASGEGRGRSVTVTFPSEPLEVLADPQLTQEIFAQLLDNAIQFTAPGGQIQVSAARRGDAVELSVRDDGAGITAELLPRIFKLFMRKEASGERTHSDGLGVGLTVVQKLVEQQGGEVEVHSQGPGRGSEFRVRLPSPVHQEETAGIAGTISPHCSPLRVLAIDNDQQTAESVAVLLNLWGYEARTCYDGTEALREARDWRPDVVLLDIGMPGMDGFEVAAHFRDEERLQGIVLIALTGYGQDEDRQRAREAGFHHYLVKPVPPETLHELLSGIAVALGKSATDSAVRFRGLSPFRGSHRAFLAEIDETAPWSS